MKNQGGVEVERYSFFNLGGRRDEWLTPYPDHFTLGKHSVPIL